MMEFNRFYLKGYYKKDNKTEKYIIDKEASPEYIWGASTPNFVGFIIKHRDDFHFRLYFKQRIT